MVELVDLIVLIVANGIVDVLFVAWVAGMRSRDAMEKWLESDRADVTLNRIADRAAERVQSSMEPRLTAFEERLDQPVQLDLAPIVAQVTDNVVPRVTAEVDRIRAVIDGKLGYAKKAITAAGEAIAEGAGEMVAEAAGLDPADPEAIIKARLARFKIDETWAKEHPVAAFGLEILRESLGGGAAGTLSLGTEGMGYNPGLRRRK